MAKYIQTSQRTIGFNLIDDPWVIFNAAAKIVAFDDCTDEYLDEIVIGDKHYKYNGWAPGMLIEFYDLDTLEVAFSERFPEYNH